MTAGEHGSVEERVDQLTPHADSESNLFAKAFGMIQVIGEDDRMPGSVRVRLARNVLTAAERVRMGDDPTGQLYGRGDEGQDPQPVAGRVPAHLEDGVTGQVEIVETAALKPECGAWCADGPGGLCMKDVGHAGEHGPQEAPALCLDLWHDADPLDSPDACPTCRDTD